MEGERRDRLEDMADIVRAKPAVSGRELAALCGWSEPKSIYYWLHKGRYRGLNHFKETILGQLESEVTLHEPKSEYASSVTWPPANVAFAYRWSTADGSPLVSPGDILIGNPNPPYRDGELLLYREAGRLRLAHCYREGGEFRHAPIGVGAGLRTGMPQDLIGRVTGIVHPL